MSHSDDKDPLLLDHEYDGIREFDNPLPTWWLWTFFLAIIFGFLYWIDSETAGRPTQVQAVEAELSELKTMAPKEAPAAESGDAYEKFAAVAANVEKGKEVYAGKCAACHGPEGQGLIGPNLADEFWIHGKGGFPDVDKVVRGGVLDKGMPPWEAQLSANDIKAVTVFVVSLRGTNPPNPKPPQGAKVSP